ncbi:hypothetical protein BDW42DRAFT_162942 [Aspergillus taichungensis]|uniref:Uncharacterized protein n=1 Tax=Aspergillus taichungensis TaxID=482145 RepID=A0A2J5I377_9EURO|nr:hypothetical protein BDW42DRAFT_162942 [Aspergillus taichungensis]
MTRGDDEWIVFNFSFSFSFSFSFLYSFYLFCFWVLMDFWLGRVTESYDWPEYNTLKEQPVGRSKIAV